MATFLLIFKGFTPSAEEQADYEKTWQEWIEEIKRTAKLLEAGLLEKGTLMAPSEEGKTSVLSPSPDNATGYMVIQADSESVVVDLSKKCPTCEISGVVEIYPVQS